MTREMHMAYSEDVMPILRQTYHEQLKGVYIERREPATVQERLEFAQWIESRDSDYSMALSKITQEARLEKAQARDVGDANHIEVIQAKLDIAKTKLKREHDKPNRELFDEFRAKQAWNKPHVHGEIRTDGVPVNIRISTYIR